MGLSDIMNSLLTTMASERIQNKRVHELSFYIALGMAVGFH